MPKLYVNSTVPEPDPQRSGNSRLSIALSPVQVTAEVVKVEVGPPSEGDGPPPPSAASAIGCSG